MRPRLRLLFALWIAGPLTALAVLGVFTARNEETRARRAVEGLLLGRLEERAAEVNGAVGGWERALLADTAEISREDAREPDRLRALRRDKPRLRQLLLLDEHGALVFPPPHGPLSDDERRLVDDTRELWERGPLSHPARDEETGQPATQGWIPFNAGDGFGLVFWRQCAAQSGAQGGAKGGVKSGAQSGVKGGAQSGVKGGARAGSPSGVPLTRSKPKVQATSEPTSDAIPEIPAAKGRVAVVVSGSALLQRMIAALPATSRELGQEQPDRGSDRLALEDPAGQRAYQWGTFEAPPGSRAIVTLPLGAPLGAWKLAYLGPAPAVGRATAGIFAGLAALAVVLVGGGLWLYRENTRELRLAAQRVSFVNQVSHELKTPLTNIRLYAELLEDHIAEDDPAGRQRLGIVVAESQRLGRLIHNILTFSRQEKGHVRLHPSEGVVDEIVREVIVQFTPGLAARGISVTFEPGTPALVRVDADALSQMLGNLLGNVEKYAPSAPVTVRTRWEAPLTIVEIEDHGPGISAADAERVFEPFVRLAAPAHEGIPGTGIGLGLARDLARLHGGDLRLVTRVSGVSGASGASGASFVLTLKTELVT